MTQDESVLYIKLRNNPGENVFRTSYPERRRVVFKRVSCLDMRAILASWLLLVAVVARADRVLLVPLDSRPAAGQFAQMIAAMAGVDVRQPPYETLGRFTNPGSPEKILAWLETQSLADVDALVVSTDMIAYGGLIESRVHSVGYEESLKRLQRLVLVIKKWKHLKVYGFSAIMRLSPTSFRSNAGWRVELAKLEELRDRYTRTRDRSLLPSIANLKTRVPAGAYADYLAARKRDLQIQRMLLKMTAGGAFEYLILGQDDARPYGPHVAETQNLRALTAKLHIGGRVYFCEGIDQHANVLVSRALLKKANWTPRVRLVYSDPEGMTKYANYESKPIYKSLQDQLLASGARPVLTGQNYDYTLYLNTPKPRPAMFQSFLRELTQDVDQGLPVCVADINLGSDGTADPELFAALWEKARMMRVLGFAGWNTAGNSMGTAIPASNVYLLARRLRVDSLTREVAQREFLLHRYVNDFAYHKFVRPLAYQLIDSSRDASRDETYGEEFNEINRFVRQDLEKYLDQYFNDQFLGRRFFAGTKQYAVSGLSDVKIFLPWPRAYEVRLEFRLLTQEVTITAPAASIRDHAPSR